MRYRSAGLLVILLFILNCTNKDPVSDLSDGRSGRIHFQSENSTFKEHFDGDSDIEELTINAFLTLPKNNADKVPAAILLHGLGGVSDDIPKEHINNLADNLNNIGMATFIIDSQTPRGARMAPEVLGKVTYAMRVADAYAGLKLLSTHPKIDKNRIGVVGVSRGGNIALIAQSEKVRDCYIEDPELRFSAVLLLYPLCYVRLQDWDLIDSPVLMLLGKDDNITPATTSIDVANKLKAKNILTRRINT